MRRFFQRVVTAISAAGNLVGMVLIAIMVLHITAEVIARSIFNTPIPGTIEIATHYYMIAVAFVPLGYVQWMRGHIEAEAIADLVPSPLRNVAALLGSLASIAISLLLAYATFQIALRQTQAGAALWTTVGQIPIWPGRWMLPLGFGALAAVLIYQLAVGRTDNSVRNNTAGSIDVV